MNKKWRVTLLTAVAILALSVFPLAAQESNTSKATLGNFGTDVDDFLDVHSYGGVEFDEWFSFAGYDDSNLLSLGYAFRLGGLYLGAYYSGNIIKYAAASNPGTKTETIAQTYTTVNNAPAVDTITTTTAYTSDPTTTNNKADIFLGVAGMGFKLGFWENLETSDRYPGAAESVVVETPASLRRAVNEYVDYSRVFGIMLPSLIWGMGLDLGGITLKPSVGFGLGIIQNSTSYTHNVYTIQAGNYIGNNDTTKSQILGNYIQPQITAGVGLDFAEKDGAESGLGLEYGINFDLYSNSYEGLRGASDTVAGTVSMTHLYRVAETLANRTETDRLTLTNTEKSGISHSITPSYWYANKLSDQVSLGFTAEAGISFGSVKNAAKYEQTTVTTVTDYSLNLANNYVNTQVVSGGQNDVEISTFEFAPAIAAGLTFAAAPDKFIINAGIGAAITYSSETTLTNPNSREVTSSRTVNGLGTVTMDTVTVNTTTTHRDEQKIEDYWTPLTVNIGAGFTLYFTDKFAVDTLASVSGGTVNVTSLRLLFTLKN
jgi:hypothetical protein